MTDKEFTNYIVHVLRHEPQKLDLTLDTNGASSWEDLKSGVDSYIEDDYTIEEMKNILHENSRGRLELDDERVRVLEGHTTNQFTYEYKEPPETLYYLVPERLKERYLKNGIQAYEGYIKIATSEEDARDLRSNLKNPTVLSIMSQEAWNNGIEFYEHNGDIYMKEIDGEFLEEA